MNELRVALKNDKTTFRPGETISGAAGWKVDKDAKSMELRLFWRTKGKGTEDAEIVDKVVFEHPQPEEVRPFSIQAPASPYSFSGKLISLIWSLELVALPDADAARMDLVISPSGQEVVVGE